MDQVKRVGESATELGVRSENEISGRRSPIPYRACMVIGLGGLFAGVTGPLLSTFIVVPTLYGIGWRDWRSHERPPLRSTFQLSRSVSGNGLLHRTSIGGSALVPRGVGEADTEQTELE